MDRGIPTLGPRRIDHAPLDRARAGSLIAYNERTFKDDVSQDDLYDVMLRIASHTLTDSKKSSDSDTEVATLARYVRNQTRKIESGDRAITYRQLRSILGKYGFEFENHNDNHIDVVRYVESSIFGFRKTRKRVRIKRIPYPMDGAQVGRAMLKDLREHCELSIGHGIDSQSFYSSSRPADYFIARYSKTLRRLART
jgi:death on curing protein